MATLQAVGFRRRALALSLLQESLFATLAGTLVALVAALVLLEGVAVPFSVGTFSLSPSPGALLGGLGGGLALGVFGSLPPACACLRPPVPVALRSA
jgi:putative ABC transport system permease protein